jgi:hypothetical protein
MTEKQKYAIKLAIDTMDKQISRHCNTVYGNRRTGVIVGYGEAINILSDMVTDDDSRQTNADRIRSMSDEELADYLTTVTSDAICGSSWDYDGWIKELQSKAE